MAWGAVAASQTGANRIVVPIDETQAVTLLGNVHPFARSEFDLGAVSGETRLERMLLQLEPSAAQQAELDALVEAQHDPKSPLFHHWLTPAEYSARFGVSTGDLARITTWLQGHGFTVDEVAASNRLIIFSGTAAQVQETFHTQIHRYQADGVEHIANALDPQIPAALAGVVGGVVSLHDFRRQSAITSRFALTSGKESQSVAVPEPVRLSAQSPAPQYTSNGTSILFPADWATIYDLNSLYTAGTKGTGTSIAIVGRSNINPSDVATFRAATGLPVNPPTVILVSTNPGLVNGDQDESTLDVEWSGGIAPAAAVRFVVGASTATSDGVDLSAQYIVNHVTAPVVSTSYGSCEQSMGTAELSFYNGLWQQAASEGISVFVSSGDSGAAGCYGGSSSTASGTGVNGLCSSPYSTCVGGTEFNEGSNFSKYWSTTNNSSNEESALTYIPEVVWNESGEVKGGSGLWASTGGASVVYLQPAWQKGVSGTSPANGMRAVPDIAMDAAQHDAYVIYENGGYYEIAGTSASSPSFAGVMALLVQSREGKGQGNANPGLYGMLNAAKDPFHPTPSGNNSVPGVTGFAASGETYNLATGLGSVDGALLVSGWPNAAIASTDFALTASASSGSVTAGKSTTFTVSVTETGNGKTDVALAAKAPGGVTVGIQPTVIVPGTTATVTVTVGSAATTGAQNVQLAGSDSSGTQSLNYVLTVAATPTLTLSATASSVTLVQGGSATDGLTVATGGSYTGAISLGVSGLPSGVTAQWSTNPIAGAAGTGSYATNLTLAATSAAKVGAASVTVTANGDGLIATQGVTLQVQAPPSASLSSSPAAVSMQSSGTATVIVTAAPSGSLTVAAGAAGSSISVASGLPKGVTASWSSPSVNAAGAVMWTLTLAGNATASAGTATLGLSAKVAPKSGAPVTASINLPLTLTSPPPTLTLSAALPTVAVVQGKTGSDSITVVGNSTYSGTVSLSVSGLPAGVMCSWTANPLALSAENGSSTLTLTASATAAASSATITVTASGDGVKATKQITLQVQQAPGMQMTLSASAVSMTHTSSASFTVTVTPSGGLSLSTLGIGISGLPGGMTPTFGKASLSQTGVFSAPLTLVGSSAAKAGTSTVTIIANEGGNGNPGSAAPYSSSQTFTLTLK